LQHGLLCRIYGGRRVIKIETDPLVRTRFRGTGLPVRDGLSTYLRGNLNAGKAAALYLDLKTSEATSFGTSDSPVVFSDVWSSE